MNRIQQIYQSGVNTLSKIDWLPPLLVRIFIGYLFFVSGKGKLQHLDRTTGFFEGLGIPLPHLNAILASSVECFGGILLMAGFLTRLVSIPLAIVMGVAIATAQWSGVTSMDSFAGLSELAYLLMFLWLATAGPGKVSVDHLLRGRRPHPASATPPSGLR